MPSPLGTIQKRVPYMARGTLAGNLVTNIFADSFLSARFVVSLTGRLRTTSIQSFSRVSWRTLAEDLARTGLTDTNLST